MKRIIAMILTIAAIAALLCACGEQTAETVAANVTTTTDAAYDDGYAIRFADGVTTDDNGNKVYEFTEEQYEAFTHNHNNVVSKNIQDILLEYHPEGFGEYAYINEEKKAVMIGIHEGEYDAEIAQTEAQAAAEESFKYFQNLKQPIDTIRVVYCDAGDQSVEYASFEFTVEK